MASPRGGSQVQAAVTMSVSTLVDGVLGSLDAAVRERCDAEGIIDALQSLGCAGSLADLPGGLVGAKGLFGSYYAKVDVSSLQEPTPLALGGMLTMGALRLQDAAVHSRRARRRRKPSAPPASQARASCARATSAHQSFTTRLSASRRRAAPQCRTSMTCVRVVLPKVLWQGQGGVADEEDCAGAQAAQAQAEVKARWRGFLQWEPGGGLWMLGRLLCGLVGGGSRLARAHEGAGGRG